MADEQKIEEETHEQRVKALLQQKKLWEMRLAIRTAEVELLKVKKVWYEEKVKMQNQQDQ